VATAKDLVDASMASAVATTQLIIAGPLARETKDLERPV